VHRVKAGGTGLSSMSPDRKTNRRIKIPRNRKVRDRVNNKKAAKVVRSRQEYYWLAVWCGELRVDP